MKKRTILGYMFTLGVIAFSFSAVYYFNYSRLKRETEQKKEQLENLTAQIGAETGSETAKETGASEDKENPGETDAEAGTQGSETEDSRKTGTGKELKTNDSMVYVVGQYDWSTGTVTETVEKFPEELLDLTRQELLVFLREHPEYGTLLSFSEHAVYLRKNDSGEWDEYNYYLILEDEGLMVYHPDQTTLYLDTGIMAGDLSEENRELLEKGFYVKTTSDLFDFLQTVTS